MTPAMPHRAYLRTSPTLTSVEELQQALPDNAPEWIAALLTLLTALVGLFKKRKAREPKG